MCNSQPARRIVAVLILLATLAGVAGCGRLVSSSGAEQAVADDSAQQVHAGARQGSGEGELPDGVTAFDDQYPGVANLDPALLEALRRASTDAAGDGVQLYVNSGWRSTAYQARLFDDAVSKYGSRAEAARWVATPATSPHVSGNAVDVGEWDAAAWLAKYGEQFGLCQTYLNEPWHLELRPKAVDHGCPSAYPDPSHDPRMQQ